MRTSLKMLHTMSRGFCSLYAIRKLGIRHEDEGYMRDVAEMAKQVKVQRAWLWAWSKVMAGELKGML